MVSFFLVKGGSIFSELIASNQGIAQSHQLHHPLTPVLFESVRNLC
jgi:hypothetical protein